MLQKRNTHIIKDTKKVPDQVNQAEKKDNKSRGKFGAIYLSLELKDKSKHIQEKRNHISEKQMIMEKSINSFLILLPFYKFIMKISETI